MPVPQRMNLSDILHYCQEQARCLFHKEGICRISCTIVRNRQDACSTRMNLIVGWAGEPAREFDCGVGRRARP